MSDGTAPPKQIADELNSDMTDSEAEEIAILGHISDVKSKNAEEISLTTYIKTKTTNVWNSILYDTVGIVNDVEVNGDLKSDMDVELIMQNGDVITLQSDSTALANLLTYHNEETLQGLKNKYILKDSSTGLYKIAKYVSPWYQLKYKTELCQQFILNVTNKVKSNTTAFSTSISFMLLFILLALSAEIQNPVLTTISTAYSSLFIVYLLILIYDAERSPDTTKYTYKPKR